MSDNCTSNCQSCSKEGCGDRKAESFLVKPHSGSRIKKVIGIVSGKGGVGKSMVTSLLTVMFQQGYILTDIEYLSDSWFYFLTKPECRIRLQY